MNQLESLNWIINMEKAYAHDVGVFASQPTRGCHIQSRRHVQHLSHVHCGGWEEARLGSAKSHLANPNVNVDSHAHSPFRFAQIFVEKFDVRSMFMTVFPHLKDSAILGGSNLSVLSA